MKHTRIQGIVTKSACSYVPLNILVDIVLNKNGFPIAIHRADTGAGTYLFSEHDMRNKDGLKEAI